MENKDLSFKMEQGGFTYRVGAIIIKDNKLLMAKNKDYPYYYTIGGKVEINETSEEAVVREVYEETGVVFEIDRLSFIYERFFDVESEHFHQLVFFFLMKENSNMDFTSGEKETLHWLPLESLDKNYLCPEFLNTNLLDNIKLLDNTTSIKHIILKEKH